MKYLLILFLLLCEFTFGQIPGYPRFTGTIASPTVYTLSYTLAQDLSSASVTAQVINTGRIINATENNTGRYPIIESGILWGSGSVNINTYSGRISNGAINGDPFTRDITPLPEDGSISIVAYATTSAGTFYGKALNILQQKVRSPFTGKIWMTYNLGATALANVSQPRGDTASYGYLYQWGRRSDGHQIILPLSNPGYDPNGVATSGTAFSSPVTTTLASSYTNTTSSYISNGADWLTVAARNNNLWQGINGLNNPCPVGFRVPSETEFTKESANFSSSNAAGALNSFLMLPSAGLRSTAGVLANGPTSYFNYDVGRYWTSTVSGTNTRYFGFNSTQLQGAAPQRSFGYSVRCIGGDESSGGTAKVSSFSSVSSSTGDLMAGVPISGVTQTISANVQTIGTYDIVAITNGITFTAKGTFAGTQTQTIVLTASGTPTQGNSSGTFTTFALNTSPSMSFTRTVSGASTNGTAEVGSYTPTSSTGTMIAGQKITGGVSQTISANVTTIGNYNIKAINNGVTYSASGTFTNPGVQDIVLNASGTPISSGTFTFSINTTPSTTFSNTTIHPSTMGTAEVSGYSITINDDQLKAGITYPSQGNTSYVTITATVTKKGTYNISTNSVNGVIFYGSGTFEGTGTIQISLAAEGTAKDVSAGNTWTLNTNPPTASFSKQTFKDATTNGSAYSESYELIQPNELMYVGVSSSKQRFAADISRPGTYNLVTELGPVIFAGSGTFSSTGINYFDLTASVAPTTKIATQTFRFNVLMKFSRYFEFIKEIANVSTNGQGLVSNYGIGSKTGTMFAGNLVSNVSQTITASVSGTANAGSYLISTNTVNGVTYAGTGQLANGNNNITLTATGTPISTGTYSFTINTTPSTTFTNTTIHTSTNGTAVVNNYTIGSATGTMIAESPVSGVTQTITANVETAGTYTITTNTTNGVTYTASGTFTSTGSQDIVLTAVGTPISPGTNNFTLNTTPNVTFTNATVGRPSSNGTAIVDSYTSISSEGELYAAEGLTSNVKQTIRANVTKTGSYNLSTITNNGITFAANGTFTSTGNNDITLVATGTPISTGTYTFTLNTTPGNNFNRQVYLIEDPSTNGKAIVDSYTSISSEGELYASESVTSNVKQTIRVNVTKTGSYNLSTITNNGITFAANGTFTSIGNNDITLVATGTPISTGTYTFTLNTTPGNNFNRQVYLIQDPSTNGKAIVDSYTSISSGGTMYSSIPVSSVTQTIRVNVTKTGSYNLSTITNNGITFAANGTFTSTGDKDITLVATGTPISTGTYTFTLNTTPGNNFNRLIIDRSSGGTALITWNGVSQSGITTEQTAENNRVIVREIEASTYNPPFVLYIAVNVTQIGTYNIETYGNRTNQGNTLRLVGSGTFTTTGVQTIPLNFYGAAVNNNGNPLNHYFYLPSESFNQYTFIKFSQ
jgi:hypothetical protein